MKFNAPCPMEEECNEEECNEEDCNEEDVASTKVSQEKTEGAIREMIQAATKPRRASALYQLSCPQRCRVFFRRKYVFDRCLGGVLLVVASPAILTLYGLVRITSPGPGLYRQCRVGLHGKEFEIIKLRSMAVDAEKPGKPKWASKNDPRVTKLGRFLRKLHLDELPQLWNVYKGHMSLVGPRPERPEICVELAEEIEGYYQRNVVKPGVTGLAQINLPPDETYDDVRRKQILDLHYIENAGIWLDSRMIFATALRLIGVKGSVVMEMMKLCRLDLVKSSSQTRRKDLILPVEVVQPRESSDCIEEEEELEPALACMPDGATDFSDEPSIPNRPR